MKEASYKKKSISFIGIVHPPLRVRAMIILVVNQ
jgi:hypothetical protein